MGAFHLFLAASLFSCLVPASAPDPPAAAQVIREQLSSPRYASARWGIQAVSLASGQVLFAQDAGKYFLPASTAKLFSTALALCALGPDFRIRTSVYGAEAPGANGVLSGDLVLYGRGDPRVLPRWRGGPGGPDPLEALAGQIQAAGVRSVAGDLVADDSYFATPPYGPGWEAEDLEQPFGAEPSALTLHDNMVDLWIYPGSAEGHPCLVFPMPGFGLLPLDNRTGTGRNAGILVERALGQATLRVTGSLAPGSAPVWTAKSIHEPARLFGQLLLRALARRGIAIRGQVRVVHARDRAGAPFDPGRMVELAHLESPPVASLVRATLKDSNNLYAHLLLLQAGAQRPGRAPGPAGVADGLAALRDFLTGLGIAPDDVLLEDGSGLSRKNLVKPAALVQLLAAMARRPEGAAYRAALPVAGMDGTLGRRMVTGQAFGNVRAKSGTLRHTHALAGYLTGAAGEPLAFAVMLNQCAQPGGPAAVDAVAESLASEFLDFSLSQAALPR
jgi:D-alanyl-D-alanine carboxypeptidase/D-alanyl-D-alanine-endopeptidase (penicillin-binding protein 4)